jgi:hypothetical protein
MEKVYAYIKDGIVTNVSVFDDPSEELLDIFKNQFSLDLIVLANEDTVIGGTFDGENFFKPEILLTEPVIDDI